MPRIPKLFERLPQLHSLTFKSSRFRGLHTRLAERVSSSQVQSYLSTSEIPFVNLAFEQYLLKTSPPDSVILFLYVNRPSIIIGTNQNPWLEVNLRLLRPPESPLKDHVDLVRRHSGGGTVFHDHGNVNWTVICPSSRFTKDKHAEMVVRALRRLGVERARVNERHDIVLDQGDSRVLVSYEDMYKTPFTSLDGPQALKVSGSAYKLTRGRALHHGTCLLQSPNLKSIGQFLRSPAKPYIKARGVESVSSPISNIGVSNSDFINAVRNEFEAMYSCGHQTTELFRLDQHEILDISTVRETMSKLKDLDWIFARTPQFEFSFSTEETNISPENDVSLLPHENGELFFRIRHGVINEGFFAQKSRAQNSVREGQISGLSQDVKLHEIEDWDALLPGHRVQWMNTIIPPLKYDRKNPDTFHSAASRSI